MSFAFFVCVSGQFGSEAIFNSAHLTVETFVQGSLGYLVTVFEEQVYSDALERSEVCLELCSGRGELFPSLP